MDEVSHLASYRRCLEHLQSAWPAFQTRRLQHLQQQERYGQAPEKVAENIIADLFTAVLDWTPADLNHQVGFADLLLTRLGIKYLLVELKRPRALAWNRSAVERALDQACRYADEQHVQTVAVSDGVMFFAADRINGGLHDRVFVDLASTTPPEALWWLSVHGIYRLVPAPTDARRNLLPPPQDEDAATPAAADAALLHPKYKLPACCFAYAGNATDPHSWKLPFRCADGSIDTARLPKAVQAILSNYRGTKVGGIPEPAIPDVLVRLARAAAELGKMPPVNPAPAPAYAQLALALEQMGRLGEALDRSPGDAV